MYLCINQCTSPALLEAELSVYQFSKQMPLLSLCSSFKRRWSLGFQPCPPLILHATAFQIQIPRPVLVFQPPTVPPEWNTSQIGLTFF